MMFKKSKRLTLSSAIDWRFLSGFCWLTGPEVLGLPRVQHFIWVSVTQDHHQIQRVEWLGSGFKW